MQHSTVYTVVPCVSVCVCLSVHTHTHTHTHSLYMVLNAIIPTFSPWFSFKVETSRLITLSLLLSEHPRKYYIFNAGRETKKQK